MILLLAIAAGLLIGLALAHWRGEPYQAPNLHHTWLVALAFLPQFIAFYIPITRQIPDWLAGGILVGSQCLFLIFAWLNRRVEGMAILFVGLLLNIAVIAANGGFMPISPETASRLVSTDILQTLQPGSRFGIKDILLPSYETRLEWLADRFLPPGWFHYQFAFSLGDVLIAVGILLMLSNPTAQKIKYG